MKIYVIYNCPEGVVDISKKEATFFRKDQIDLLFINWKKVKTDILVHSTMQMPIKGAFSYVQINTIYNCLKEVVDISNKWLEDITI